MSFDEIFSILNAQFACMTRIKRKINFKELPRRCIARYFRNNLFDFKYDIVNSHE